MAGGRPAGVDLMTTMRERSQARGRRSRKQAEPTSRLRGKRARTDPADLPAAPAPVPDELLPLEDLPYDPDTMGLPPAAGRAEADLVDPSLLEDVEPGAEEADLVGAEPVDALTGEATLDDFFGPGDDANDDGMADDDAADDGRPDDDAADAEPPDDNADNVPDDDEADDVDSEAEAAAASSRRKSRTSVPSWDDIMFGTRNRG